MQMLPELSRSPFADAYVGSVRKRNRRRRRSKQTANPPCIGGDTGVPGAIKPRAATLSQFAITALGCCHYGDDVGWVTPPTAAYHLVLTTSPITWLSMWTARCGTQRYCGAPDTFPVEIINISCQREAAGTRSMFFWPPHRPHPWRCADRATSHKPSFGPWFRTAPSWLLLPINCRCLRHASVTNIATDANSSQQTLQFTLPTAPWRNTELPAACSTGGLHWQWRTRPIRSLSWFLTTASRA